MLCEVTSSLQATCQPLPDFLTSLPFSGTNVALLETPGASPRLLAVSRSSTGRSQLFIITLATGAVEKLPIEDQGACLAVGADGLVYLGTHSGRLLRYDPHARTLSEFTHPLLDECFVTAFRGAAGHLYFGSSPGSFVVEIDPLTQAIKHYYHWRSDALHPQHATAFADLPDGRVVALLSGVQHQALLMTPGAAQWERTDIVGVSGELSIAQAVPLDDDSLLIAIAPGRRLFRLCTRTWRVLEAAAPLPDDDTVFCLRRVGARVLAAGASGAIYRLLPEGWESLGHPLPNDPCIFTALPDGRLVGVSVQGRLLQSTIDQRMYTIAALPTREVNGEAILALGMGPDRKLYFALAHNMRLGSWDPEEGDIAERFIASPFVGEVSALGFAGERLLIGWVVALRAIRSPSATRKCAGCAETGALMAYYPELRYRLLENPRLLGMADLAPRRPLGPMVHHESNVYFAAAAVTSAQDGALIRFNPLENALTPFEDVIAGQNLTSLVADRLSGLLVLGGALTERSTSSAAAIAFWSPYQEQTSRLISPHAGCPSWRVWAAEGGRIYCTDGAATLLVLSSAGDVLATETFPLGPITSLITDSDGKLYGLAGGWFFHLDAETQTVERLVEATGSHLAAVRRDRFAYSDGGKLYTIQLG